MKRRERPVRVRLAFCLCAFLAGYALLGLRAWQLQLLSDDKVSGLSLRQKDRRIVLSPQRGAIYDARGRALALSMRVPSLFADPSEISDAREFARRLAPVLGEPFKEVRERISQRHRRFAWLKRKVDPAVAKKAESLGLKGLHVMEEWSRFYPERSLAAQVIGFIGSEGQGLEGLERHYEKFLRSESLVQRTEKDARGRPIYSRDIEILEPEPGANLHLTIDNTIQHIVENELDLAVGENGSRSATGILMDPRDGRIVAMASYPQVNPNRIGGSPAAFWRNRPVEEVFEPGSMFKVFTLVSALENGTLDPKESILCRKGSLKIGSKVIRTHEYHDWLWPAEVLKYSDNIGTARIALHLGRTRFYDSVVRLGFGKRTGIDFPAETPGLLAAGNRWRDIELANISFGQGVGTTAVQLARALAAIANGGFPVTPYLVERVAFEDGRTVFARLADRPARVLSERSTQTLTRWMEGTTRFGGTGVQAVMEEYRTAGKTGTSQKIDPATGDYSTRKVVASFMGFAPVSKPRLVGVFVFDEPTRGEYGGELAAPVFRRAVSEALRYLGVPPDREEPSATARVASLVAEDLPPPPAQDPFAEEGGVPDLRGLTIREVLARAERLSLPVKVTGTGVAVRQRPAAGGNLSKNRPVEVDFAPVRGGRS